MLSPYQALDLTDDRGEIAAMVLGDLGDVIKVEHLGGSQGIRKFHGRKTTGILSVLKIYKLNQLVFFGLTWNCFLPPISRLTDYFRWR